MALRDILGGLFVGLVIERPARTTTLEQLATRLETKGAKIADRIRRSSGGEVSRRQVRHITGIERWGQRRLRVALDDPPIEDEYDGYQPPEDADWNTLAEAWEATRRETVALARTLAARPIDDIRIRHNQFGPLSVGGWLVYLSQHASRESLAVR
jgi:hypothetical protein